MGRGSLVERVASGEAVVGGVLSGTSADGIDVALCRLAPRRLETGRIETDRMETGAGARIPLAVECLVAATRPFEPELGSRVRAVLAGEQPGLRALALLHRDLGRAMGAEARAVAEEAGLALELLGSHGQTVWHHDGREASGPATLQLGDGCWAAEAAGCAVVSDFRQRDCAAGGQGAPLVALVDEVLFPGLPRPAVLLNLGGIANVTVLRAGAPPLGFDVGPCNALLDGLARRLLGQPCDEDGASARAGRVDAALLVELGDHPFFAGPAPKSTGRDTFGEDWVDAVAARAAGLVVEDVLRTACELVAVSVRDALAGVASERSAPVVVAGGGVHNRALREALAAAVPGGIETSSARGVPVDAREAVAFAVLAGCHVLGQSLTEPAATGARPGRVLGKLSPVLPVPRILP